MAERMIRRAGQAGRLNIIIEILRRVERTGLKLDDVYLARVFMFGALQTATQSGWSAAGAAKAAKQAEEGLFFLEDPKHAPEEDSPRTLDPRRAPDVVASAMGLMAFHGLKGKDATEGLKVEKYAKQVLDLWENRDMDIEEGDWPGANQKLVVWGMVERGLEWTVHLLGVESEIGKQVDEVLERDVRPLVKKCKEILLEHANDKPRLGLITYEELERAVV